MTTTTPTTTQAPLVPNSLISTKGASGTSSTTSSTNGLSSTMAQFLKILTTELQNQDPTQPMDPAAFVGQLATLNEVQATVQSNQLLTAIEAQIQASSGASLTNYIGDQITAQSNAISLASSGSSVTFGYTEPSNIKSGTIVIKDSSGNQVFSAVANPASGNQTYTWNGKNVAGTALPAGNYTVTVNTIDNTGKAGTAQTYTAATVQSVDSSGSTPKLVLSTGSEIPVSGIMNNSGKVSNSTTSTN